MDIIIGSRGSDLALWQAHFVRDQLENLGHQVTIKIIQTKGDKIQHLSFDKLEGKGFFTKEIEESLLSKSIDLAVHSHKDLETTPPEGLKIGAVSYRENPTDRLLIRKSVAVARNKWQLPDNAVVGTSSARRKSQILRYCPTVSLKDLRGNVPTRIDKLRSGQYDAIILASAGILRLDLDLSDLIEIELDPTEFIPAPAQGVLGLQIREDDDQLSTILAALNNSKVETEIGIERSVLKKLHGGCQLPLGVYCFDGEDGKNVYVSFSPEKNGIGHLLTYQSVNLTQIVPTILRDLHAL